VGTGSGGDVREYHMKGKRVRRGALKMKKWNLMKKTE
jgi:hypothetical protein